MEKITDKIAAVPNDGNYFSLEFFPPKTEMVHGPDVLAFPTAVTDKITGLLKLASTTRTNVSCPSAFIRDCNMGGWR